MWYSDKVHEKDTLQEDGDFLRPDLNMEDSTVEILNSTQSELGMNIAYSSIIINFK